MKIGIFLEGSPKMGGGFFQSLKSTLSILRIEEHKKNIDLIITDKQTDLYFLNENLKNRLYKPNKIIRYFAELFEIDLIRDLFIKLKIIHPFSKFIKKHKYDLIIFLGPSMMAKYCGEVSFILNIFDLDHKKNTEFPEHNSNFNFEKKEKLLKETIFRAFKIIVAHKSNKIDLLRYYDAPNEKIIIQNFIPFLPSLYERNNYDDDKYVELFNNFDLPKNKKIIFYPAQFWSHKNHKYIIDVAKTLKKNNDNRYFFVFCGAKKSNFKYIKELIEKNEVAKYIKILDFISENEMISLYLNSHGVVMPTYCGPTNLPLYESFYFKKIIFYTKDLIPDDDINNRLTLIDITSPLDLINKLEICFNDLKIKKITESNFEYYKLACSENSFQNKYKKILDEYLYLSERWKN